MLHCAEQRRLIARGIGAAIAGGIACQLLEISAHFPFGLHQQGLRVAGKLACGQ
ncbi:hypothetical protein D3C87_1908090 [compost metagenome]